MGEYEDIEQRRYFQDHEIKGMAARLFNDHPDAVMRFMLEVDMGMVDLNGREIPQGDFHGVTGPAYAEAMVGLAADWWEELRNRSVFFDGMRPEILPSPLQQEFDINALSKNGVGLEHIPPEQQTHEMRMAAVQKNGSAIRFIPADQQSEEIRMTAVRTSGHSLDYIPIEQQSEAVRLAAVQKNGFAIRYIPVDQQSEQVRLAAAQNYGLALEFIPADQQSEAVRVAAVQQDRLAIHHIPDDLQGDILRLLADKQKYDHLGDSDVSVSQDERQNIALASSTAEQPAAEKKSPYAWLNDLKAQVENLYPKNTPQPEEPQATASVAPEIEAPLSILDVTDANAHLFKPAQAGSMLTPAEQDSLRQEMQEDLGNIQAIYREREYLPQAMEQVSTEPAHELASATEAKRLDSVREDGLMLQHIPADQQSLDVQIEAVMQNEKALEFVPGDDAENVLREASLRAENEPAHTLEIEDPRVDFEAAGYQEQSYQPDILPPEDYDLYFEESAFDPMQADHLEGFDFRGNSHAIFIEFSGVDVDGNVQKYSLTEYQVMTMEDSPLKELVTGEIQGGIDRLEMMREGIALDAAKAEGVNGTPVESVGISGTHGDGLVATVRLAGSNEDMQIPLNPETFKPLREEHHTFEHIIELSARQDHTPVPGNLDDAKIKAAELSELLDEPVRVNECQGVSEDGDGHSYGFEIEIGEGGSKKKIHAMNMADLHRQLDEEIINDRERSGVINVHKETFVTQHDTCVSPGQPETLKPEIYKPEEVEQEKKRSVGI